MLLVSLSNPKYKQFEGKRMNQVIQTLGRKPIDVLFELLENNDGSIPTVYFHHSEDDMRYALASAVCVHRIGWHGGRRPKDRWRAAIRTLATTEPFLACSAAMCARKKFSLSKRPSAR